MKAILKVSDLKKISKAAGLNLEDLKEGNYWLKKGESASYGFTWPEIRAIVIYLVTREVNDADRGGMCAGARSICSYVDCLLNLAYGTALSIVRSETLAAGRWIIAELNTGLDHLTLTNSNPYATTTAIAS